MRILIAAFAAAGLLVSATGALAQQPLRVGYIPVMGVAQIFVAEGEGWTKQAGIPLAMSAFESGPNMIQALSSGSLDVYVAGLAPLLVARAKGIDVRVVAATVVEEMGFAAGASFAPFFDGRTPAQAFKAFHEKTGRPAKLATQPIGSGPHTTLNYWLWEVVKADKADVQIIEMGIDATQGAILTGAVEGGSIREPALTRRRGRRARRVRRQEPQGGGEPRARGRARDQSAQGGPQAGGVLRRGGVRQGPGPGERSARSNQVAADAVHLRSPPHHRVDGEAAGLPGQARCARQGGAAGWFVRAVSV
jgi:hypothetical protein